jgi:RNA polymerase sigma factor (sigma-70 family)
MRILEATLNVREIRIYDSDNKFDEAETIAVLEKQKLIVEEFRRWIWQDEDRIWEIEEAYNNMFAELEKPVCDGSKLSFPEMSPKYRLYDYQKDAVERIINERNTLLAAVDALPPREREIMELRFGLHGKREMTQKEVADLIGISQSYISRLEKKIIRKLRLVLEEQV